MKVNELHYTDNIYIKRNKGICTISIDNSSINILKKDDLIITKIFPTKYLVSIMENDIEFKEYMSIKNFKRKKSTFEYEYEMKAFIDICNYSEFYPSPFVKDIFRDIINSIIEFRELTYMVN